MFLRGRCTRDARHVTTNECHVTTNEYNGTENKSIMNYITSPTICMCHSNRLHLLQEWSNFAKESRRERKIYVRAELPLAIRAYTLTSQ